MGIVDGGGTVALCRSVLLFFVRRRALLGLGALAYLLGLGKVEVTLTASGFFSFILSVTNSIMVAPDVSFVVITVSFIISLIFTAMAVFIVAILVVVFLIVSFIVFIVPFIVSVIIIIDTFIILGRDTLFMGFLVALVADFLAVPRFQGVAMLVMCLVVERGLGMTSRN